jgi:hypothetical protein
VKPKYNNTTSGFDLWENAWQKEIKSQNLPILWASGPNRLAQTKYVKQDGKYTTPETETQSRPTHAANKFTTANAKSRHEISNLHIIQIN